MSHGKIFIAVWSYPKQVSGQGEHRTRQRWDEQPGLTLMFAHPWAADVCPKIGNCSYKLLKSDRDRTSSQNRDCWPVPLARPRTNPSPREKKTRTTFRLRHGPGVVWPMPEWPTCMDVQVSGLGPRVGAMAQPATCNARAQPHGPHFVQSTEVFRTTYGGFAWSNGRPRS